jgi:hypothetical protein
VETSARQTAVAAAVENLLRHWMLTGPSRVQIFVLPPASVFGNPRTCCMGLQGRGSFVAKPWGLSSLLYNGVPGGFHLGGEGILSRSECDEVKNVGAVSLASDTSSWTGA